MEIIKAQANSVQQFSALNAFRNNRTVKPAAEEKENSPQLETSSGVETTSAPSLMDRIDVNDIRKCAESVGEYNITDDEIKYGLMYGRSVIAEWLC